MRESSQMHPAANAVLEGGIGSFGAPGPRRPSLGVESRPSGRIDRTRDGLTIMDAVSNVFFTVLATREQRLAWPLDEVSSDSLPSSTLALLPHVDCPKTTNVTISAYLTFCIYSFRTPLQAPPLASLVLPLRSDFGDG